MTAKRKTRRKKSPPQVTLGGTIAETVWNRYILPLLQTDLSTREIAEKLGISHNTVSIWRRAYL